MTGLAPFAGFGFAWGGALVLLCVYSAATADTQGYALAFALVGAVPLLISLGWVFIQAQLIADPALSWSLVRPSRVVVINGLLFVFGCAAGLWLHFFPSSLP